MAPSEDTPAKALEALPHIPASDVKRRGWRGLVRVLRTERALLVTNHGEPEAVIVSAREYAALLTAANQAESQTASSLAALRRRFDERLAALRRADAGDRLRAVMKSPAKLRGKVKAGTGY